MEGVITEPQRLTSRPRGGMGCEGPFQGFGRGSEVISLWTEDCHSLAPKSQEVKSSNMWFLYYGEDFVLFCRGKCVGSSRVSEMVSSP